MTLLHEAVEEKKFDVRVMERNLQRGLLKAEDVDKFVKTLGDDSANAEYVSLDDINESPDGKVPATTQH